MHSHIVTYTRRNVSTLVEFTRKNRRKFSTKKLHCVLSDMMPAKNSKIEGKGTLVSYFNTS